MSKRLAASAAILAAFGLAYLVGHATKSSSSAVPGALDRASIIQSDVRVGSATVAVSLPGLRPATKKAQATHGVASTPSSTVTTPSVTPSSTRTEAVAPPTHTTTEEKVKTISSGSGE
jgi:hypothetical protein